MNYVIAAYGVTALVLVGYGWMLLRERSELRRSAAAAESREDPSHR